MVGTRGPVHFNLTDERSRRFTPTVKDGRKVVTTFVRFSVLDILVLVSRVEPRSRPIRHLRLLPLVDIQDEIPR